MEIQIKKATIENIKDIQRLNKLLFDEEFDKYDKTINCDWPLSKEGEQFYKERIEGDNGCAFVLIDNNKVIGYLVGSLSEDEFYRNIDSIAELDDMFIEEQYRGSGNGGRLYEALLTGVKKNQLKELKF